MLLDSEESCEVIAQLKTFHIAVSYTVFSAHRDYTDTSANNHFNLVS